MENILGFGLNTVTSPNLEVVSEHVECMAEPYTFVRSTLEPPRIAIMFFFNKREALFNEHKLFIGKGSPNL